MTQDDREVEKRKKLVRRWLTDEGFTVQSASAEGLHWLMVVSLPEGRPLMVGHPKSAATDRITVRVQMKIQDPERFYGLPTEQRRMAIEKAITFCWLLDLDVTGLAEEHDEIFIEDFVFAGALDKDTLLRRARRVMRGTAMVMQILARAVSDGGAPPPFAVH